MFCQERGHEVRTATSLADALKVLAAGLPDVLFCDIGLPDGTGWDLPKRANLPASVFPVAMSGFGMSPDNRRSQGAGFRRHLLKPFRVADLDAVFEEARQVATPTPDE